MTPATNQPHRAGASSRVIQGFFPGGRPRIIQSSPAPVSPVQARPVSPPAPLLPGRPATGALQPALRPGHPPRPILPTRPQPGAIQAAKPPGPQTPQPIQPKSAAPSAVQPSGGNAFALPGNFTLKPRGSGQPLPEPIQKKMESFFNTSFADVRVHIGHEASTIGALAFTHGTDLYFAPGQYNPQSSQGQQLLGHELTHVVQQRAGRVRNPLGTGVAVVQDPALEVEAERMGLRAASAVLPIQAKPKPAGVGPVGATCQTTGLKRAGVPVSLQPYSRRAAAVTRYPHPLQAKSAIRDRPNHTTRLNPRAQPAPGSYSRTSWSPLVTSWQTMSSRKMSRLMPSKQVPILADQVLSSWTTRTTPL